MTVIPLSLLCHSRWAMWKRHWNLIYISRCHSSVGLSVYFIRRDTNLSIVCAEAKGIQEVELLQTRAYAELAHICAWKTKCYPYREVTVCLSSISAKSRHIFFLTGRNFDFRREKSKQADQKHDSSRNRWYRTCYYHMFEILGEEWVAVSFM